MPMDGEGPGSVHDDLHVVKVCEFFAHVDTVTCAHIARRSAQLLATGSADRVVNVWKIGNPRAELTLRGHSDTVNSVRFTPNEETIISGCRDGSIRIWDLNHNGALKGRIHVHNRAISALDPHPFGDFFATGTVDGRLEIWNSKQRKKIATYPGNSSAISVLKLSPDGQYIVAGHSSGAVKVWDLTACRLRGEVPGGERGQVNAIVFHPEQTTFMVGSESGLVEVVEVWPQEVSMFSTTDLQEPIQEIVLNSSANALLCAGNAYIGVLAITQAQVAVLGEGVADLAALVDLSYDPNDSVVVAASVNNTAVSIHSISASEELRFDTKPFQPVVKEPFMGSKRKVERAPPGAREMRHLNAFDEPPRAENVSHTEHAIDDYFAADSLLPLLLSDHEAVMSSLNERLTKMKQLCALWSHGHIAELLDELIKMSDLVVAADFLAATHRPLNGGVLTLQLCPLVLSVVKMVLQSTHNTHIKSALNCLDMVLDCYSGVISSTRKEPLLNACDIARDERLAKCNECYENLTGPLLDRVELLAERNDGLQDISRDIAIRIRTLE